MPSDFFKEVFLNIILKIETSIIFKVIRKVIPTLALGPTKDKFLIPSFLVFCHNFQLQCVYNILYKQHEKYCISPKRFLLNIITMKTALNTQ